MTIEKYLARMMNEKDSGRMGKAYEMALREYFSGREQDSVKSAGKVDHTLTFKLEGGKRGKYTIEIKTACGEIEMAARAQFIVYCPEVDPAVDAEEQGYVFSRDEWNAFLTGYEGRGKFIREDAKRGHAHIQSFYTESRPKASKPIAEYIWATCNEQMLVADWLEELRGL